MINYTIDSKLNQESIRAAILQSSSYYPYVAQAQTAIPALPSSDLP